MTVSHQDGTTTTGTVRWVERDCGCGGSYHGTCGDLRAEIDPTKPVTLGRWKDPE